jgi:hypothetical protein
MKTSYFVCAVTAFGLVVGGVSAWPTKVPVSEAIRLVPAKPLAEVEPPHPPVLPPIVTDPEEPKIIQASAQLPKVPPPPSTPMVPPLPAPPVPSPKLPPVPPPVATPVPMPAPAQSTPPAPLPNVPPPMPLTPPTPLAPTAAPGPQSVVLLTDNKLVEGTVTESGTKVIVRRGAIDQPFTKDQVQYIGKTKDDCFKHLLEKVKADDASGHFKLARWCMYNGLREQALAEAQVAVKLQPNYAAAAELAKTMEESIRLFNADGTSKLPPPVMPDENGLPKAVDSEPEIGAEALTAFTTRVQPVLVNLCADCHAKPGHTGTFKMACGTTLEGDSALTKHNLKAALAQIKKADAGASPLLVQALAAHGGMKQAAFANRAAPAFRVLEAWVFLAAGSVPPEPKPEVKSEPKPAPEVKPALPPVPPPPLPPAPKFGEDAKPAVQPTGGTVETGDEFDPSIFNRAATPPIPVVK